MMKLATAILLLFVLAAFGTTKEVSDEVKRKMFCCACARLYSTAHDYVVVKVKNLKTGETKDICTTPNMLGGAVNREAGKHKTRTGEIDCKRNPTRYFEFAQDSALWNIGFSEYSRQELEAFREHLSIDSIVEQIKCGKLRSVNYGYKEERYFAHIMFNQGVVTTSGCFGTSVSYFKSNSSCDE